MGMTVTNLQDGILQRDVQQVGAEEVGAEERAQNADQYVCKLIQKHHVRQNDAWSHDRLNGPNRAYQQPRVRMNAGQYAVIDGTSNQWHQHQFHLQECPC